MIAAQKAKQAMEQKLSAIAGVQVEITIRGERGFTLYFDSINQQAADALAATVAGERVEIDADSELGTCIYVN